MSQEQMVEEMVGDYVAVSDILNQSIKESISARNGLTIVLAYVLPIFPGLCKNEIRKGTSGPTRLIGVGSANGLLYQTPPSRSFVNHSQDDVRFVRVGGSGSFSSPLAESSRASQGESSLGKPNVRS